MLPIYFSLNNDIFQTCVKFLSEDIMYEELTLCSIYNSSVMPLLKNILLKFLKIMYITSI